MSRSVAVGEHRTCSGDTNGTTRRSDHKDVDIHTFEFVFVIGPFFPLRGALASRRA